MRATSGRRPGHPRCGRGQAGRSIRAGDGRRGPAARPQPAPVPRGDRDAGSARRPRGSVDPRGRAMDAASDPVRRRLVARAARRCVPPRVEPVGLEQALRCRGTSAEGPSGFALYRDPGIRAPRLLRSSLRYADLPVDQFAASSASSVPRRALRCRALCRLPDPAVLASYAGCTHRPAPTRAHQMAPPDSARWHGCTSYIDIPPQTFTLLQRGRHARLSYRTRSMRCPPIETCSIFPLFAQLAWRRSHHSPPDRAGALADAIRIFDSFLAAASPHPRSSALPVVRGAAPIRGASCPAPRFSWDWPPTPLPSGAPSADRELPFLTPGPHPLYLLASLPAFRVDLPGRSKTSAPSAWPASASASSARRS